jgi:hypothetical protein
VPTRDASSPATYTMATAGGGGDDPTGTSASFTPPVGAVITVGILADTAAGTVPTPSISNTGFVVNSGAGWGSPIEARGDNEGTGGYVAVYRGVVTSSAAGTITTTATNTGVPRISSVYGSCYVDVWTDGDADQSTAVNNEGSFTTNTFTSTALTTSRAGSQVVIYYGDWNATGTPTTPQQGTGFTGSFYSGIRTYQTSVAGAAGSNIAGAFDGPGTGAVDVNWVALEILAASGGAATGRSRLIGGKLVGGILVHA